MVTYLELEVNDKHYKLRYMLLQLIENKLAIVETKWFYFYPFLKLDHPINHTKRYIVEKRLYDTENGKSIEQCVWGCSMANRSDNTRDGILCGRRNWQSGYVTREPWGIGWIYVYQREEGDGKLWVYSGVDGT